MGGRNTFFYVDPLGRVFIKLRFHIRQIPFTFFVVIIHAVIRVRMERHHLITQTLPMAGLNYDWHTDVNI
jgi:hypothetical protein